MRGRSEDGSPRIWSVWYDGPGAGAHNMATDHAMACGLGPDEGVLRFYTWDRPTVSLGRNEPARDAWDPGRLEAEGVGLVRRPTGGRSVLHHRELTYAVAVPASGPGSMRRLYRGVNQVLVRALRRLGVPAELAPRSGRSAPLTSGPCFDQPAEGEVVVGGRKLVGSAQVRVEGSLLQHGSILICDDQGLLPILQGLMPAPPGDPPTTCIADWTSDPPSIERLIEEVRGAFVCDLAGRWPSGERRPHVPVDLERRLEAHYRSPEWTWRR